MKRSVLIVVSILVLVLSIGCDLGLNNNQEETGALSIGLASPRSVDSDLDREIASYDITLTHTVSGTVVAPDPFQKGDPIYFPDLIIGEWSIDVNALNASGTIVADGSAKTNIVPKSESSVDIYLSWLDGSGTLDLTMSWTEGAFVGAMTATAYVVPLGTTEEQPLALNVGEGSAACNQSLPTGLYKLFVTLQDSGEYYSGRVDVINIMKDATTTAVYEFEGFTGEVGVTIIDPADMIFPMSLSAESTNILIGQPVTITASMEDADSYEWYNGDVLLTDSSDCWITLTSDTPKVVTISCIAVKGERAASADVEITFGQFDPAVSMEKYLAAKAILDQAMTNPQETLILDEVYSLLNSAVALDPDNSDAVLALSILDLCGFLIDDDIEAVMQDMLGLETYPDTYADLYANIFQFAMDILFPSDAPVNMTGFENILYDYSTEDRFNAYLPYLAGWDPVTDGFGPDSYFLQMLDNLTTRGYDADDVVDGILDALGDSLDKVTGNLTGLSEGTRFEISQDTVFVLSVSVPIYYTSAETKAIAALLYQLQSYAYLAKAVELGFDFNSLLDSLTFDMYGNPILPKDYSPFANGFLGIDNENAAEAVADAKASFLKSLSLMHESMTAIAAREAEGTEDALFISPDNPWYTNSWADISDYLLFADHIVGEIENSVINDVQAIIPLDWIEDCTVINDYVAADFANWPTESTVSSDFYDPYRLDMNGNFDADIALNFNRLFDPATALFDLLLELDATGDVRLYHLDSIGYPIPEDGGYDGSRAYYCRVPDITFNGLIPIENLPATVEQYNVGMAMTVGTFEESMFTLHEWGDGTVSLYVSMNYLSFAMMKQNFYYNYQYGNDNVPVQYPLAYHILTPAGETHTIDVWMSYGLARDLSKTEFQYLFRDNTMTLESAGTFWSSIPELYEWMSLDAGSQYDDMSMYKMSAVNPFVLPLDTTFSIPSDHQLYPTSGMLYLSYPIEEAGYISIEAGSATATTIFLNGSEIGNGSAYTQVVVGDELVVAHDTSYSNYCYITCCKDDAQGLIDTFETAPTLQAPPAGSSPVAHGRTGWALPPDLYKLTAYGSALSITMDLPSDPDPSINFQEYLLPNRSYRLLDSSGNNLGWDLENYEVVPDATYYIEVVSADGLDYEISWLDAGFGGYPPGYEF